MTQGRGELFNVEVNHVTSRGNEPTPQHGDLDTEGRDAGAQHPVVSDPRNPDTKNKLIVHPAMRDPTDPSTVKRDEGAQHSVMVSPAVRKGEDEKREN